MSKKEKIKRATDEIISKLENRFPDARIIGVREWADCDIAIEVENP